MFKYPKFINGKKTICLENKVGKQMMMDILVYQLKKGQTKVFSKPNKEIAILLLQGSVKFSTDNLSVVGKRKNVFEDGPYVIHVCKDKKIKVTALTNCEILYQSTTNNKIFKSKIYRPKDILHQVGGQGVLEGTMLRDINTVFDYENAPYSNMVLGEVLTRQGRWCSYVPHHHPQPEVYYYKFLRPEGFGGCFLNENVYYIKDGSCCYINGGSTHVQSTAPGFAMYYAWMIRHLKNNPWNKTRIVDKRYKWLEKGSYGKAK